MDYRSRWYDPELGRFISPDTIIPNAANPQSWNRYAYVLNSPIRYNDPSGHKACDEQDENGRCYTEAEFYNQYMKDLDSPKAKNPKAIKTSQKTKDQIIFWEGGFWETPYLDGPDHKTGNCTIGFGTLLNSGPCSRDTLKYYEKNPLKKSVALTWFERDILKAENIIKTNVHVPLTQSQFDALVSYIYNTGGLPEHPFFKKKIPNLLNNGYYYEVASAIESGPITGKYVGYAPGLVDRRQGEAAMFLYGP
jgi:GH24 family phage-related lysozyme (muramidase)